ncbi:uncharacterized protein B0I36DRAFT_328184 [Microdochium trichocladiopsis]|uniref:C3H1-type domain-containing protein n=1 Tax=Microdochium trichocladiopsis TaxID=1682393 RepID=A0A9P8Y5B0_9PEZI|nr:uncharacterized protein B0I36DRAFT_328184 [Microdochium trichocladiopsis]KAH7027905.1 hypothetical protein B0I36DRAFT_328184 [Microdochium trichocladiopsis]
MSHNLFSPPPGLPDTQRAGPHIDANAGYLSQHDPSSILDHYLRVDTERQNFLQSLIERINSYTQRITELELDLDDQKRSRSRYQQQSAEYERGLQLYEHRLKTEAFVVVLVDGDGAKFRDDLVRDLADGGERAAQYLKRAVRKYLADAGLRHEDVPILVRVYANLNDLSKSLRMSQITQSDDHMRIFAERFTNSSAEIDFVNVGKGKENADSKIRRMLNHYHKNLQCQKIFLAGCCHDNGYLHDLREYRGVADEKLVLLETTTAEPGFRSLGYPLIRFDDVFRSEPLANEHKRGFMSPPGLPASGQFQRHVVREVNDSQPLLTRPAQSVAVIEHRANPSPPPSNSDSTPVTTTSSPVLVDLTVDEGSAKAPTAALTTAPAAVASKPPVAAAAAKTAAPKPPSRSQSIITSGNGGTSISYANVGGTTEHSNVTVKLAKKKDPRVILCNADGFRIDPPAQRPAPSTPAQTSYQRKLDSIKPSVFCNDHYLRGRCQWGTSCDKTHNVELTPAELAIHRYKARTSICPAGPTCDDYGCYLSHHCIREPCKFGNQCPFNSKRYGDLHHSKMDLVVTTKWTEGNSIPDKIRK